ncbi:MAG: aminopeptidase P family protein [Verrucomicrobiae bacterium]|nr:aminopeptidase P family protein [Verrucomicrobiae bacterium]
MKHETLLIVADSEKDANMLYVTGMFVPDPFIWFRHNGRRYAVMSDLEIDRAKRDADVDRVLALTQYRNQLIKKGFKAPKLRDILVTVLKEYGVRSVTVPDNFPLALALQLKNACIRVRPAERGIFPERECKRPDEVAKIRAALKIAQTGLTAGIGTVRRSRIGRDGFLYWHGGKLTSELLRAEMDIACKRAGGLAANTIVAGGNQGCDPHERGHGPLRAHQSIILDIFPRDERTGYFGDITRTVVRGRASESLRKLYATVEEGQRIAFRELREGVDGGEVHKKITGCFANRGFKTGKQRGRMGGFFHGTGHGLGLEIHESPRVSIASEKMKAGHVVTVEPGLYYWGIGGVRIEDVVLIRKTGNTRLSSFPNRLEV